MNWKVIRWVLLIILVALNLGLFAYSMYIDRQMYVVPRERIENLEQRFESWGYRLPKDLPRNQAPKKCLLMEKNDLESRADSFFTEAFEKSFMVDARVLYTCGSRTLTLDRDRSSLVYQDNGEIPEAEADPETQKETALTFAAGIMNNSDLIIVKTAEEEDAAVFYICERYEEEILFSNRTAVTISHGTVTHAAMTQYKVTGYDSEAQAIYPIDELLYSCRAELKRDPAEKESSSLEPLDLLYGYFAAQTEENTIFCNPALWVGRSDGSGLLIDRYTDEIVDFS